MPNCFKLVGREVVPCSDEEMTARIGRPEHHLGGTTIGKAFISTVFVGTNQEWREGAPPLFFETMVFGLNYESAVLFGRCGTYEAALAMHQEAVEKILAA